MGIILILKCYILLEDIYKINYANSLSNHPKLLEIH